MKNVLITGGNGFIGSNFITYMTIKYPDINFINYDCNYYSTNNIEEIKDKTNFINYERKLQDKSFLLAVLEEHNIDTIVHFAAQSHVDNSFYNSLQYTDDNILGTHVLLECIRIYNKIELFIHISTDEVYGENENDDDENIKLKISDQSFNLDNSVIDCIDEPKIDLLPDLLIDDIEVLE